MTKMNFNLSDGLFQLRRALMDKFPSGGMQLDDAQTDELVAFLKELGVMAQRMENEISRHRWNEPALREQIAELEAELARPNTNVRLFPVVSRPLPGGAA